MRPFPRTRPVELPEWCRGDRHVAGWLKDGLLSLPCELSVNDALGNCRYQVVSACTCLGGRRHLASPCLCFPFARPLRGKRTRAEPALGPGASSAAGFNAHFPHAGLGARVVQRRRHEALCHPNRRISGPAVRGQRERRRPSSPKSRRRLTSWFELRKPSTSTGPCIGGREPQEQDR